jgi:glutamine cyclotransferase
MKSSRALLLPLATAAVSCDSPKREYVITRALPHDTAAYTQGLLYTNGILYESTGEYGRSDLRRVDVATGQVEASVPLAPTRFGEGLTLLDGRLYQLTWQSHVGYVYEASTLARVDSFLYGGEGWGLATDGRALIMSDGTAILRFLDPDTFQVVRRVTVRDGQSPLAALNELEYVHGSLFANVYPSDWIVVIDPRDGQVRRWINMSELLPASRRTPRTDVLNGIAYNDEAHRFFITGKRWPSVFEIRLTPAARDSATAAAP